LRGGLLDGTIDAVCSDHIALSDRDKDLPFAQAVPDRSVWSFCCR